MFEIWGALTHGGKLIIIDFENSRDPSKFHTLCSSEGVTVLCQTPSAFYGFAKICNDVNNAEMSIKKVILAGEALNTNSLKQWWELCK